ncbi:MAG: hypothetical protein GY810_06850 [Aureispira sp.]|nr:hypothetical protein [Aureispira sp.]
MDEFGDHEGLQEHLNKMLENLPKEIRVVEYGIDADTMRLYQRLAEYYKSITINEYVLEMDLDSLTDEEDFRKTLVQIACLGSVEAFRKLEQFEKQELPEWKEKWAQMALMQCQIQLENELRDEPIGFIATGLGGRGNKIRYFFAVKSDQTFDSGKARFVQQIFEEVLKEQDAELEEVVVYEQFVQFKILLPFNISLIDVVVKGIEDCDFLDEEFFITNTKHPTKQDLIDWAEGNDEEDLEDDDNVFE